MIVNFRYTKWFLMRFFFVLSIFANVYAIMALNATEQSLAGCEKYIEQIQTAEAQYVELFNTQQEN